jgi:hypothetical protein
MNCPIASIRAATTLLCGLLLSTVCLAENPGVLIRAGELKAQPFTDADLVVNLPENALLDVIGNKGGWSQVKTSDGRTGWVRLLNIRLGKPEGPVTAKQTFAQIGGVIRTGTTKSAATTGVKGLTKEEISNSKPNPLEVRRLEAFKAKPGDAEKFAASRKLTVQEVPELKP